MITRRAFVNGAAAALAARSLARSGELLAADAPPETTRIRLTRGTAICFAPLFVVSEGLLQAEGFADISYAQSGRSGVDVIADGTADFGVTDISWALVNLDKGRNLVVLGGLHAGCYELFASGAIKTVGELKGRKIAIPGLHTGRHLALSAMLAHVGINPSKDVQWVTQPAAESMQMLAAGKIDAYLGFPPEPQELRASKTGRLLVSMTTDRPWSEHYCCIVIARREYLKSNPVATKRALRALLKAATICTNEPERASRILVDRKITDKYDHVLTMMKELPYSRWRDYDAAASLRFYALRLHEAGLIRTTPQKLIAQGSDFRFIDELRREMKA